jgi:hypothetical protein
MKELVSSLAGKVGVIEMVQLNLDRTCPIYNVLVLK